MHLPVSVFARPTPTPSARCRWSLNCRGNVCNGAVESQSAGDAAGHGPTTHAIWIKDPLAILADGAERGIVVQDGKIVELVPKGGQPATAAAFFEAGDHVVLPGLINTHHHFYQTLTRALPAALDRELFPWLQALYPVWARLTPESLESRRHRGDGGTAAVRLHHDDRSSLRFSRRAWSRPSISRWRSPGGLGSACC